MSLKLDKSYWKKKLKMNCSDKILKRLFFFKINPEYTLLLENIQNNSTRREVAVVHKSSEVYFETQMMGRAGLPATSLLFWIITMESQTGPIQQTATFANIFFKGKRKKNLGLSFHCSMRPKSFKAICYSQNKAILLVAIPCSRLLR